MAALIGGALINAFAFTGSSYLFKVLFDDKERRRHDLALEQLQKARDEWNQKRSKQLDYVNQRLREEAQSERHFKNVDEAMQEYFFLTGENLQLAANPEPQLEDYLDEQTLSALQNGELALIGVGMLASAYIWYKYL